MKIDEHLYLVGGGDYGFNLSHRLDCNSYILDTGAGLWMIDAGFDGADEVVENIHRDGLDPHKIEALFVTHYHADHSGALAEMRQHIGPQLQIAIAEDAAPSGPGGRRGRHWAPMGQVIRFLSLRVLLEAHHNRKGNERQAQ